MNEWILTNPDETTALRPNDLIKCVMSTADALAGEKRLFDELFVNYSTEVRPKLDSNQRVDVSLELALRQFQRLVGNMTSLLVICLNVIATAWHRTQIIKSPASVCMVALSDIP